MSKSAGASRFRISDMASAIRAWANRRRPAARIAALGASGTDILVRGWDGEGFGPLARELSAIARRLLRRRQGPDGQPALPSAIAALDDAVMLLATVVRADLRPDGALLDRVRAAIEAVVPADVPDRDPPAANAGGVAALVEAGIPLYALPVVTQSEADRRRRARLAGWLQATGGSWGPPPKVRKPGDSRAENDVGSGKPGGR